MTDHVQKYRVLHSTYEVFSARIAGLLEELIRQANVKVHFVEQRAKTVESFAEKLTRPSKNIDNPFVDMPDLAGVRLVLYYLDDVQKVGELIKSQFTTIEEVTEHQPDNYSVDQFGYLSLHYVVKLNDVRSGLPEWKQFKDLHAEIQVRTVLQHSWAAVSHVLQYKREGDVPFDLRRRLFRLAGLFELADEEFIGIRDAKMSITHEKTKAVKSKVPGILVDAPVIREFLNTSSNFTSAKKWMLEIGFKIGLDNERFIGSVVEDCERIGIRTIEDLESALDYDYSPYLRTAKKELGEWSMNQSFALWLLIIGAFPDFYSVQILEDKGWDLRTATGLIKGLKERTG